MPVRIPWPYCFRDKARYWSKIAIFFISHSPHLHSTPPLGEMPSGYCHTVWCGKTRMVWLPDGEKRLRILFVRFDTIPACGGRTYRRMDRRFATAMHSIARYNQDVTCSDIQPIPHTIVNQNIPLALMHAPRLVKLRMYLSVGSCGELCQVD